jgi:hypothetical protein
MTAPTADLVSHWTAAPGRPRRIGTDDGDPAAYDAHPRLAVDHGPGLAGVG